MKRRDEINPSAGGKEKPQEVLSLFILKTTHRPRRTNCIQQGLGL